MLTGQQLFGMLVKEPRVLVELWLEPGNFNSHVAITHHAWRVQKMKDLADDDVAHVAHHAQICRVLKHDRVDRGRCAVTNESGIGIRKL